MGEVWTTRVDPVVTRRLGVEEVHHVCFEPDGWPGSGPCIAFGMPECELQFVSISLDGEPVVVLGRPEPHPNVDYWLGYVCAEATALGAFLVLSCATTEEAERIARVAAIHLREHHRSPLERLYEPLARGRDGLH